MATAAKKKEVPRGALTAKEVKNFPTITRLRGEAISNYNGCQELNLNRRQLRAVPSEVFQMSTMRVLRLAHNHIEILPVMVAYLRALRVLDLQHNILVHLPDTMANCRYLAELHLTDNRLNELPRTIGGLRNLRVLALGENKFEQLPQEVAQLKKLRTLDLHGNKLWQLPFSLQNLRQLLLLNVSDNALDHVPLVITKITSLRALNLSRNHLTNLPMDFDALKSLRELNLSQNKFVSITSLLVTLKHLKYLNLANNELKFLPSQMSLLQNLHVLHLQNNCLQQVPSSLRRLCYYNVSNNQLTSFSVEGMKKLQSLTASRNKLSSSPRGLYKLKGLKFLHLDHNHLVEVEEDLGLLHELQLLDLSGNDLTCLPHSLYRLPKLHSLNVRGNPRLKRLGVGTKDENHGGLSDLAPSDSTKVKKSLAEEENSSNKMCSGTTEDKLEKERCEYEGLMSVTGVMDFDKEDCHEGTYYPNGRQLVKQAPNRLEEYISLKQQDNSSGNSDWQLLARAEDHQYQSLAQNKFIKGGLNITLPNCKEKPHPQVQIMEESSKSAIQNPSKKNSKSYPLESLKGLLFWKSKKTKNARPDGDNWTSRMKTSNSLYVIPIAQDKKDKGKDCMKPASDFMITRSQMRASNSRQVKIINDNMPDSSDPRLSKTNRTHFSIQKDDGTSDGDTIFHSQRLEGTTPRNGYHTNNTGKYPHQDGCSSESEISSNYDQDPGWHQYCPIHQSNQELRPEERSTPSDGIIFMSPMTHHQHCDPHSKETVMYCSDRGNMTGSKYISSNTSHRPPFNKGDQSSDNSCNRRSEYWRGEPEPGQIQNGYCTCNKGHNDDIYGTLMNETPARTRQRQTKSDKPGHSPQYHKTEMLSSCAYQQMHLPSAQSQYPLHQAQDDHFSSEFPKRPYKSVTVLNLNEYGHGRTHDLSSYTNQVVRRSMRAPDKHLPHPKYTDTVTFGKDSKNEQNVGTGNFNAKIHSCLQPAEWMKYPSHTRSQSMTLPRRHARGFSLASSEISHCNDHDNGPQDYSIIREGDKNSRTEQYTKPPNQNFFHFDQVLPTEDIPIREENYYWVSSKSNNSNYIDEMKEQKTPILQSRSEDSLMNLASYAYTSYHLPTKNAHMVPSDHQHLQANKSGHKKMDSSEDMGCNDIRRPALNLSQFETFNLTYAGGRFLSSQGPEVIVDVPAHAVKQSLQVTFQLLFISPSLLNKVSKENHFVGNIIVAGPAIFFYTSTETSLNTQATITIPAPASPKGEGHLVILTIRKDNSCLPCSNGYRSGKSAVTLSTWHFTGKVALITKAKCKYKACKSMEHLLQIIRPAEH